jgi:hypothetical protein
MDNFSLRASVVVFREKPIEYDYSPEGIGPEARKYMYRGLKANYYKDLFDDMGIDMNNIKAGTVYEGDGYLIMVSKVDSECVWCRILERNIEGG